MSLILHVAEHLIAATPAPQGLSLRGREPGRAGPGDRAAARAHRADRHDPRLGEVGLDDRGDDRAVGLRGDDDGRPPRAQQLRRGRRRRDSLGSARADARLGRPAHRRDVPVSRRARRWRRRLLAAALLPVAVVVAAQFIAVRHPAGAGAPAPAVRPSAPARAVPGVLVPRVPRTGLAGLRWSGYHGVELPSSPRPGRATPPGAWRRGSRTRRWARCSRR